MCKSKFNCHRNRRRTCHRNRHVTCDCYDSDYESDYDSYNDSYHVKFNADKRTFDIKTNNIYLLTNTMALLYSLF